MIEPFRGDMTVFSVMPEIFNQASRGFLLSNTSSSLKKKKRAKEERLPQSLSQLMRARK